MLGNGNASEGIRSLARSHQARTVARLNREVGSPLDQERFERAVTRDEALAAWRAMRSHVLDISGLGGITPRSITEDYQGVPRPLRRSAGVPIDEAATSLGYDNADDMIRDLAATYRRYQDALADREVRPAHDDEDLQSLFEDCQQAHEWMMNCQARRLERSSVEWTTARQQERLTRQDYRQACLHAGIRARTV